MTERRIKLIVGSILAAPLLVFGTAAALESHETTTNTNTNTEQTTAEKQQLLKERLEKRKAELKAKLTALEERRIQQKCKAAQTVLTNIHNRAEKAQSRREEGYDKLVNRLNELEAKIAARGVDTTELKSQIQTLSEKTKTFNEDLKNYVQALDDMAKMDCSNDPTAFKATLEAGRTLREKLKKSAADIHNYVKETIKPTLVELRQAIAEKQATEGGTE